MRLNRILDRIEAGEYDPTVSGSEVEFYCIEAEYGINPEPRDPGDAAEARMRNPTYGEVLTAEELAFVDQPTVRRAMGAGWLVTNPVPTSIRVPKNGCSPLPITQTDFDHISDYKQSQGLDSQFGVATDRTLWEVTTGWVVDVPDGYSLAYHQPFNYGYTEFRTIPGIIDADQLPQMLRIPVELTTDRGDVRFDEPIAQIVPFKRPTEPIEAAVDVVDERYASRGNHTDNEQ
jgi:hypothetical protein